MSMREYGIQGYGVNFDQIANYIDRNKLIDYVCGDEIIDNSAEGVNMSNTELIEQYLMEQDSIIEFCYADDATGYILIYNSLPWQMFHKDYEYLTNEEKAKEYIWDNMYKILDDRLTKEDFCYKCDYINDTYLG